MTSELQCRLCLNRMYNMKNILLYPNTSDFEMSLPESISTFFGIKVDKNDRFTKLICANCISVIQLMHIHRKKFRDKQNLLEPLVKEESVDAEKDDGPPILEPYFGDKLPESILDANVVLPTLGNEGTQTVKSDYIKVPKAFFNKLPFPAIEVRAKDIDLANLALYGNVSNSKLESKRAKMKKKYLRHVYNKGRPGAIRELIQEKARKTLYISDFDQGNRLKSIYEYDFNLKPKEERTSDVDLWKLDMQLSVFVCSLCSQVFYSKSKLDIHQKLHESFQRKMDVFKVIF